MNEIYVKILSTATISKCFPSAVATVEFSLSFSKNVRTAQFHEFPNKKQQFSTFIG